MLHISKGVPGFWLLLQPKDGFAKAMTSIIAQVNLPILTIFTSSLIENLFHMLGLPLQQALETEQAEYDMYKPKISISSYGNMFIVVS